MMLAEPFSAIDVDFLVAILGLIHAQQSAAECRRRDRHDRQDGKSHAARLAPCSADLLRSKSG